MGGSAQSGALPSTTPWPRHTAPPLRACIPNTSDKNGMPREAPGRSSSCRNGASGSGAVAAEKQFLHLPPHIRRRSIQSFAPWIDDNGPLWTQLLQEQTDGLPHAPPDAIPHHGFTQRARRGEPDPRALRLRLPKAKSGKQRAGIPHPPVVDSSEILRSKQTNTFRKTSDGDYLSELTVSFFRPRARRRESTARPFFVSMRLRKPCVFARWRLFG